MCLCVKLKKVGVLMVIFKHRFDRILDQMGREETFSADFVDEVSL